MKNRRRYFRPNKRKKNVPSKQPEENRLAKELQKLRAEIIDLSEELGSLKRNKKMRVVNGIDTRTELARKEAHFFETKWKLLMQKNAGKRINPQQEKELKQLQENYMKAQIRFEQLTNAAKKETIRLLPNKKYIKYLEIEAKKAELRLEEIRKKANSVGRGATQKEYFLASKRVLITEANACEAKFKLSAAATEEALRTNNPLKARTFYEEAQKNARQFMVLREQADKINSLLIKEPTE